MDGERAVSHSVLGGFFSCMVDFTSLNIFRSVETTSELTSNLIDSRLLKATSHEMMPSPPKGSCQKHGHCEYSLEPSQCRFAFFHPAKAGLETVITSQY